MLRIIDNKRIDLTDSEWELYQKICTSYDVERRGIQGKDLFTNLFETDDNGIIIFLKPPQNLTSMEVYMFLVGIMIHQHLGAGCDHINKLELRLDEKIKYVEDMINKLDSLIKEFELGREHWEKYKSSIFGRK